jgi:hypothetical protein
MAEQAPWPIPQLSRAHVLAQIACMVCEEHLETDDPGELAQLATAHEWTVGYTIEDQAGIVTMPGQRVEPADLPILTAIITELFESNPDDPVIDLEELIAGAKRRLA